MYQMPPAVWCHGTSLLHSAQPEPSLASMLLDDIATTAQPECARCITCMPRTAECAVSVSSSLLTSPCVMAPHHPPQTRQMRTATRLQWLP